MQNYCRQLTTGIALLALLAGTAASASTVVFEKVELFKGKTFFTESFQVDTAGTYQATLTDFEFPKPMKKMGLNITTSNDTLGSLFAPGSFDFEADPGTYYVSFFALADSGKKRDKNKDGEHKKNKDKDKNKQKDRDRDNNGKHGKSGNGKHERHEKQNRSDDWAKAYGLKHDDSNGWGQGHSMMNLGQYGIEIAYLEQPPAAVPIPAAAWLFVSGLLGLGGISLKRKARS